MNTECRYEIMTGPGSPRRGTKFVQKRGLKSKGAMSEFVKLKEAALSSGEARNLGGYKNRLCPIFSRITSSSVQPLQFLIGNSRKDYCP